MNSTFLYRLTLMILQVAELHTELKELMSDLYADEILEESDATDLVKPGTLRS